MQAQAAHVDNVVRVDLPGNQAELVSVAQLDRLDQADHLAQEVHVVALAREVNKVLEERQEPQDHEVSACISMCISKCIIFPNYYHQHFVFLC